jgi:hypothetical protein
MVEGKSTAGAYTDARTCRAPLAAHRSEPGARAYDGHTPTPTRLVRGTPGGVIGLVDAARQASAQVKRSWRPPAVQDPRASS